MLAYERRKGRVSGSTITSAYARYLRRARKNYGREVLSKCISFSSYKSLRSLVTVYDQRTDQAKWYDARLL